MVSKFLAVTAAALNGVNAARPFLEAPDTGLADIVSNITVGSLPALDDMVGLPDFDWAAENYLPIKNYTYYRNGAGGEWSYRNNLEVYNRYRFIPRQLQDITNIASSLKYEFSFSGLYHRGAQWANTSSNQYYYSRLPVRQPFLHLTLCQS